MRLIDADDFKKRLYEIAMNGGDLTCEEFYKIASALDNQPTAYDVDNVVEQLERYSQNIELIYPTDQGYDYEDGIGIDIDKAKEIVKSGGIE